MDYATLNEFRAFVRAAIPSPENDPATAEDVLMGLAITTASAAIDRSANRRFTVSAAPSARIFTSRYDRTTGRTVIDIDDTFDDADTISVYYDPTGYGTSFTSQVTAFRMGPVNAPDLDLPYTQVIITPPVYVPASLESVEVTALWGWDVVPETIRMATLLQASRFLKRQDAPFGVAGSPDMGNELRLLNKLDPDVDVMIANYRRWWA